MPTSYYQTAVRIDKTPGANATPTYELSYAPIAPAGKRKVYYEDGSYTLWDTNGEAYNVTTDNVWTIWYGKPTLAEAIKPQNMCCYYEFHADGSVIHRYKDEGVVMEFYWAAPVECSAEQYNPDFDPDFVKCRMCGQNAEGSDWEVYELCSRDCMKETIRYDS
jgi:hypothetical protein